MIKTEQISWEEALERGKKQPYAWIHYLSSAYLGKTPETMQAEEMIDARFFGEDEEIRLFQNEKGKQGAVLQPSDCDYIEEKFSLIHPEKFGRELTVRHILETDCDGQAYIGTTMLCGWKGEE